MNPDVDHTATNGGNETVALLTRLMAERGIPVVSNVFRGKRSEDYVFGNGIGDATLAPAK